MCVFCYFIRVHSLSEENSSCCELAPLLVIPDLTSLGVASPRAIDCSELSHQINTHRIIMIQ